MSVIARHKKRGGFKKLVQSLETTVPEKREKILAVMRKEDPDFTAEVEASIFSFEEFVNLNDLVLCEVLHVLNEPRTLALALYKTEGPLGEKFKKNLRQEDILGMRDATEALGKVFQRDQVAARFRIIEKARELESQGKLVLKKYTSTLAEMD